MDNLYGPVEIVHKYLHFQCCSDKIEFTQSIDQWIKFIRVDFDWGTTMWAFALSLFRIFLAMSERQENELITLFRKVS